MKVEVADTLKVKVQFESGDKCLALVDSGASGNLVSESFVDKTGLWKFAKRVNKYAVTASGHVLRIKGVLSVRSRVELKNLCTYKFTAYIVAGLKRDCYLGLPFIKKYKPLIPFEEVEVRTNIETEVAESKNEEMLTVTTDTKPALVDSVEFLRLFKKNPGGILLIQRTKSEEPVKIESVEIEVETEGTSEDREKLYKEFEDTVSDEAPKFLPPKRTIDHKIILVQENKTIHRPQYRLSHEERVELDKQVKELLDKGFIRPSGSPFNAPVLFVKKKDGSLRLCTDFRLLNESTIKDKFPLPRIEEILDMVGNAKVFSKLDLLSGYFQVRIEEKDVPKTAFSTTTGHFEWVVMPFGLSNAPATFQRFMNQILQPVLGKFAMVYLDDIVIYSNSVKEHNEHIRTVLEILRKNRLIAKKSKCSFFFKQISFLGFVIGNGKVLTDPEKVKKVKDWPTPTSIKDCQSFLGLTGFYRRFIKGYSKITAPMMDYITKKDVWGKTQQLAFEELKKAMVNAPVLQAPIFEEGYKFRVTTDASDTCLGFVLEQLDPNGKLLGVVQYGSKRLAHAELNYPVREKEFYAVITALKKFRSYLMYRRFLICTDHHSLIYIKQQKQVNNGRLARWLDFLSQFEFDIQYIKGETNSVADALSRYPEVEVEDVDIEVHETVTQVVVNEALKEKLIEGYRHDEEFKEIYDILSKGEEVPQKMANHIKHFNIEDNLLYYKAVSDEEFIRVCVPNVGTVRKDLIRQCHDEVTSGHFGSFKTYELLARSFYWNKMIKAVKRYVATCDTCQRSKATSIATQGLFKPLPIPKGRWTDITLDFVGALPKTTTGYDTVLVVVDRLSKRAHFIPTTKSLTAEGAADLFLNNIFKHHGVPRRIVSDKDVKFTATFWRTLHARLGTSLLFTTTNHPQTDGQSERTIRTLVQYLRSYCQRDVLNWDKFLFAAEFSYNSTYHDGIKAIPFEVDLGYIPDSPSFVSGMSVIRYNDKANDFINDLKAILKRTQDQLVESQRRQEERVNKQRSDVKYEVGDMVLTHKDALVYQSSDTYCKLHPAYLGPYRLVKKLNDNAFEVDIPTHIKKHRTINVQWYKKYNERDEAYPKLPPRTHREIMSRLSEIVGIAGFDYEKKLVTVFWRDCPPGLGSTITYEEFDAAPESIRASLVEAAKSLGATRIEDDSSA
jgi:hypothetical protein